MAAGESSAALSGFAHEGVNASLREYIAFGSKPSGGAADAACGAWLERTLSVAGFATERQAFETPFYDAQRAVLTTDVGEMALLPQAPVTVATVSGVLAAQRPGEATPRGAIAVATLPYARWSTSATPLVTDRVAKAVQDGAAALLIVTTGPTGAAIALNVDPHKRWPLPIAILAPRDAAKLPLGALVTYDVRGAAGVRPAFNVIGRRARPGGKRIVISTPRSAWTIAAGERGPGIAVWRAFAQWAPEALRDADITMIATSGHEYENFGGETFLKSALAPSPAETHLWAHLGAGFAARDWHELGRLLPLPSADPQRLCIATENVAAVCRASLRGEAGLESAYPAAQGAAGELGNILAAGYGRAFGLLGAHRYHHVLEDDSRCIDAGLVMPVALRVRDLVASLAR
jgi:hypothetical protein